MFNARFYTRIIAEIVAIIATAEVALMFLLPVIAPNAGKLLAAILDAACLSLIAGPMIAWRVRAWAAHDSDRGGSARIEIGRAWLAPVAVVAVGAILTTLVTAASLRNLRYNAQDDFDLIANRLEGEIERRVNRFVYGLRGMRGVYVASKSVEREEFAKYANSRNLTTEFPGAIGQGFIERVPRVDLSAFIGQTRADGSPQFAVKTTGDAADLFVIKYIEPMARNLPALGYDIGSESKRREAAERAMRTGEPSLTAPIGLVQDAASGAGFLYLLPVYRNGAPVSTEQERVLACIGWVYMPISAAEAFARIDETDAEQVDIEVFDGAVVQANNIFDADKHLGNEEISDHTYAGRMFERRKTVAVGGRTWTMVTSSTARFDAAHAPREAWAIAVVGLLATLGLAFTTFVLGAGRARAVRIAHAMTADLRRLADVAERTTNAVVITDAERRIVWANAGFTRISGYALDEVRGRSPGEFLQFDRTSPLTVAAMRDAFDRGEGFAGEVLNRGKDGREYWLDVNIQPVRNEAGTLTGFMAIETDITASRVERERLNSIFGAMAEGIVLQDANGKIIECNAAAERILGLTSDQMMGLQSIDPRWRSIHEDGRDFPGEQHPAMVTLRTGEAQHNVLMGVCAPDGERRWINISTQPIRDAQGKITAVVASFADVTTERAQRRRMDLIIQAGGLGTWEWDIRSGAIRFNSEWARMLGYDLSEIAPNVSGWETLAHPNDREHVWKLVNDHLDGKTPEYRSHHRMRRKDGTWAWILDAGQVIERDAEGKPLRAAGIHLDISESKLLEERLLAAKQSAENAVREIAALRSALDEHSILSVADKRGRIIDVNTGFCRISGYSSEELIGQDHRLLNSGAHPKAFWVEMWKTIASGRAWRGEVCNRAKNGSLYWVDSTIVPFVGEGGEIEKYVSIRFDITAQKAAQAALVEAQVKAEAANQSKSDFLANMSHEIRTPMTAILGYTDLLAEHGSRDKAPRERLEYIDTIKRNGEHLLSIINDILDVSKIEAGKMTVESVPTRPDQLVHDVLSLMDVKARAKGITLEAVYETPIPEAIQSDPVRLRQILVNIVGNAIKFTELGGVSIKVGHDHANQTLRFDVEDTGIGLTPEQAGRLFGAFVQADTSTTRKFGGTGLGLRISKSLAQMLGGDITIDSQHGKGSTFSVTIATGELGDVKMVEPGRTAVVAPEPTAAPKIKETPTPLQGVRILLAEDGPDNVRLISFHLRRAGADVRTVENGKQAVEALTFDGTLDAPLMSPPPVDVLLTDMQMPEMDGYTATRLLRAKGCTLPIIALTAHAMSGDAEKCLNAGCDAFATKPIDKPSLIDVCRRAADGVLRHDRTTAALPDAQ